MSKLPFGFEKPEDSPGFLLWQTTMLWQRQIKRELEPFEVSHPQFVIMALLLWFEAHQMEAVQGLIVKYSKLDKMTVSSSLKKLVERGWVRRTENREDTRSKNVTLTKKGKVLINQLVPLVEQVDATFFGSIAQKNQRQLIHFLASLSKESDL